MASDDQDGQSASSKTGEEVDLTLEVAILIILGVFMLLFGLLLFKIHRGDLPYAPDSTYGLFLVIVSLQIITMGKTPFLDLRRSWMVVIIGIVTAILGMYACFIPGSLTTPARMLVGIMLLVGGAAHLIQLITSEEMAKKWMKTSRILQHLTAACGLVYLMSAILGIVTLLPGITTDPQTAVLLIIYGIGFFYLSWCIQKVNRLYSLRDPRSTTKDQRSQEHRRPRGGFGFFRDATLPLSHAITILVGVLLTLLGLLLVPVNLGLIPFSPDGQLGLLLVIIAVQMLAIGETPIGQYRRSLLLIIIGIVFAAAGIVSCIVPGILTGVIQIMVGLLNIIGGALLITKRFIPILHEMRNPPAEPVALDPIIKRLLITQTAINIVGICFGITMLVPSLVSGPVIAGVLVANGLLLFVLTYYLQKMRDM
ncbi:MAG TPA: DUF308 domain-containing protein [Methanotrichaceae archaeon]|nr:DUF308 domain-containing protein [Methanotrichaceae archaeon]HQF17673.1 DUF308 domain-containing protein [Methanotrichaceae archaeon]HQI92261.1 DUF308 domain-containing protein [Methanotrichaceae archaeon]